MIILYDVRAFRNDKYLSTYREERLTGEQALALVTELVSSGNFKRDSIKITLSE